MPPKLHLEETTETNNAVLTSLYKCRQVEEETRNSII